MPRIARFWDALSRFGQPPSCKQPGMWSENSGLRQAISELVQRSGKALPHGFEPRLGSLALQLGRMDWMPARSELRAALVLGKSADSKRVVAHSETIAGMQASPPDYRPHLRVIELPQN